MFEIGDIVTVHPRYMSHGTEYTVKDITPNGYFFIHSNEPGVGSSIWHPDNLILVKKGKKKVHPLTDIFLDFPPRPC